MNRIEIVTARQRCAAAFADYQSRLTNVFERAQRGERPSAEQRKAEEQALYDYAKLRREFLDLIDATAE